MEGYLGETNMDVKDTPYKDYSATDWVLYFIEQYGQYDGGHHKQWVMDQCVRIIKGNTIDIKLAKWSNGHSEYRINLSDEPTQEYLDWVKDMCDGEDGPNTYSYDEGSAP